MAMEYEKKVKTNPSSSFKYISSDDDEPLPSEFYKNPNAMIKGLIK
jgi:hypothetical protein